jgi:hypothetical protein
LQISLFITCYNDTFFPQTGKAVVSVLEKLGHTVEFRPAQTCCGQMHYNTGYQQEALPMMRHFLEVFRGAEVICIPSSSCIAMIRDHYPKMAAAGGEQYAAPDFRVYGTVSGQVGRYRRGCLFSPHGSVASFLPFTQVSQTGRSARAIIGERARLDFGGSAGGGGVLRIRRYLCGKECRCIGGHVVR